MKRGDKVIIWDGDLLGYVKAELIEDMNIHIDDMERWRVRTEQGYEYYRFVTRKDLEKKEGEHYSGSIFSD